MTRKPDTEKAMKALAAIDPDGSNLDLIEEAAEALKECLECGKLDFSAELAAESVLRKIEERGLIPKKPQHRK